MISKFYYLAIVFIIATHSLLAQSSKLADGSVPKKFQVDANYKKYLPKQNYKSKTGIYLSLSEAATNKLINVGALRHINKRLVGEIGFATSFQPLTPSSLGSFFNYSKMLSKGLFSSDVNMVDGKTPFLVNIGIRRIVLGYPVKSNIGYGLNVVYAKHSFNYETYAIVSRQDTIINTSCNRIGVVPQIFYTTYVVNNFSTELSFGAQLNKLRFKESNLPDDLYDGYNGKKNSFWASFKLIYSLNKF